MAGDTVITVIGALTADPELRFTQSGQAVTNFTVASNSRHFNRQVGEWVDDPALFLRCNLWRDQAENVAESLRKGQRVIVQGRLRQRSFETREGDKRTVYELEVDEIGPSLRWATARVERAARGGDGESQEERPAQRRRPARGQRESGYDDPWGSDQSSTEREQDDSAPF